MSELKLRPPKDRDFAYSPRLTKKFSGERRLFQGLKPTGLARLYAGAEAPASWKTVLRGLGAYCAIQENGAPSRNGHGVPRFGRDLGAPFDFAQDLPLPPHSGQARNASFGGHSMLGPYQVAQAAHCQLGDWRSQKPKRARRAVPLPGKSVCDMTCPTGQNERAQMRRVGRKRRRDASATNPRSESKARRSIPAMKTCLRQAGPPSKIGGQARAILTATAKCLGSEDLSYINARPARLAGAPEVHSRTAHGK